MQKETIVFDTKKRLTSNELNVILRHKAAKFSDAVAKLIKELEELETIKDPEVYTLERHGKKFVIFPMVKDAKDKKKIKHDPFLRFIGEVLDEYFEYGFSKDETLLIPMLFCRGWRKLPPEFRLFKREHGVLCEVDLQERVMHIHDSEFKSSNYPLDNLEVLAEQYKWEFVYHGYGVQKDLSSCGGFVADYVEDILSNGNSNQCVKIKQADIENYDSKESYIKAVKVGKNVLETFKMSSYITSSPIEIQLKDMEQKKLIYFKKKLSSSLSEYSFLATTSRTRSVSFEDSEQFVFKPKAASYPKKIKIC